MMATDGPKFIIGVDVGGTNTDAVLLNPAKTGPEAVISSYKATTGVNVTTGIEEAIRALLKDASVEPSQVASLMIGTTHLINAVVERDASRLSPVAIIRLTAQGYMQYTPPFIDFPTDLKNIMNGYQGNIAGGVQIDGTLIAAVNEEEVIAQAEVIKAKGLTSVAIIGVYSPMDKKFAQEEHVRRVLQKALGDNVDIVCSKEIAGVGILARENATILNASIMRFAKRTIRGFKRAMRGLKLTCPLYLTSSSGQLLSADEAARFPIQIFSSGPTNSIRGAAFLSTNNSTNVSRFVVDIGGTTADIGVLLPNGFPRLAGSVAEVGGVKVNFALPQVESIGLGGGSIIHVGESEDEKKKITIGPESVGQALRQKALCFGGDTLTTTDIMVAAGKAKMSGTEFSVPTIAQETVEAARLKMRLMLEDHVDRMKTSQEPCHILLVGGGAFLCPSALDGAADIEVPAFANVANAVGAAVAEIGAETEVVVDGLDREKALEAVKAEVIEQAVARGAREGYVRIIEEDVSGLAYMEGKYQIVVKVAGPVDYERFLGGSGLASDAGAADLDQDGDDEVYNEKKQWEVSDAVDKSPSVDVDHVNYRPTIDSDRVWHLSETDAYYLSIGCYIVGCAGGGTPYGPYLQARQLLRDGGKIRIVDIDDLDDDTLCVPVAAMGSPVLAIERLGGSMVLDAVRGLEKHMHTKFKATLTAEIGGANGLSAMMLSSSHALDNITVDADLMGRAFPAFQMSSLYIGANNNINHLLPVCLASGEGTTMTIDSAKDTNAVDQLLRSACMTMGFGAGIAARPAGKKELKEFGVERSVSLAWRLGRAVCQSRARGSIATVHEDLIREFGGPKTARKVFEGKITGIEQQLYGGRSQGTLIIEKLKDHEKEDGKDDDGVASDEEEGPEKLWIPFVNENLIVEATYPSGEKKTLATVPDLIMVMDLLTGEAVGVPEYRYGLKVFVMIAAAHPLWTSTAHALSIAGPRAFGYDIDFKPCGTYTGVESVIDEFGPARTA
ncbi:hydantoinase [Ophiostoma piceae UAMH 11346]|uniref:Hydantoinase n=1 Tax=Ophiostoma piceae (strain UAMH 11346) TaxID=1262450 RepID=S3CXR3_OPHP1|nr:hydantoinase [Ophiostoma piceae UAMH 11346]